MLLEMVSALKTYFGPFVRTPFSVLFLLYLLRCKHFICSMSVKKIVLLTFCFFNFVLICNRTCFFSGHSSLMARTLGKLTERREMANLVKVGMEEKIRWVVNQHKMSWQNKNLRFVGINVTCSVIYKMICLYGIHFISYQYYAIYDIRSAQKYTTLIMLYHLMQ